MKGRSESQEIMRLLQQKIKECKRMLISDNFSDSKEEQELRSFSESFGMKAIKNASTERKKSKFHEDMEEGIWN